MKRAVKSKPRRRVIVELPCPNGPGSGPIGLEIRPLPKVAFTTPENFHELSRIILPAEQAKRRPVDEANLHDVSEAAILLAEALAASGPRQHGGKLPHFDTAALLQVTLQRLRDHALAGDAKAFEWLGSLLHDALADFHETARRNPQLAKAWGKRRVVLPVFAGRTEGHRKTIEETFEAFALGKEAPIRVAPTKKAGGRGVDVRAPATNLAAGLIQHLAAYQGTSLDIYRLPHPEWARMASKLPPFTTANVKPWIDAALALVDATFANDEELVKFCGLGDVRGAEATTGFSQPKAAIRQRIRRAIKNLAPKG